MKYVFVAIGLFIAPLIWAPHAIAQGDSWTSPGREFEVSLPDGWSRDVIPSGSDALIIVSTRPAYPTRTCGVTGRAGPLEVPAGQDSANAAIARQDAQRLMGGLPETGRRLIAFSNEEHDGVQISSIVLEYDQPSTRERVRYYAREFAVVRAGEFRYYTILCGLSLPVSETELVAAETFMNSLEFIPDASQ